MSKTKESLKERFLKCRSALKSKRLKVNLEKTKVMVCMLKGKVIQSRIDPSGICGKRVTVNSVLCTKYDQWIYKFMKALQVEKSNSKCSKIFCLQ